MTGKSVVLGLDRSPGAERALALAVRLAGSLDVPLVLVHGVAPPGGVGEEAGEAREAIEEVDDAVTGPAVAAAEAAGVRTVVQVVDDRPAQALVAAAEQHDAEVIVVGIWNESPLRGLLLGSVRAQAAAAVGPAGALRAGRRFLTGFRSYAETVLDPPPPDPGVPHLVVRGLRKTYGAPPVRALRGADLTVRAGEFVALMGPSGSGKSTLLHLVAGLDRADEGTVALAGVRTEELEQHAARPAAPPPRRAGVPVLPPHRAPVGAGERRARRADRRRAGPPRPPRAPATCSTRSACSTAPPSGPVRCPAGSASGWRSRGRWPTGRRCCSPTSPPARSTRPVRPRCSTCSAGCTPPARRSSWSPTAGRSPPGRSGSCGCATAAWSTAGPTGPTAGARRGGAGRPWRRPDRSGWTR